MYRAWGGDIINMSVLPEAKLAREAELRCVRIPDRCLYLEFIVMLFGDDSYALIATATDYDSWRVSEAPATVAEVFRTLKENADRSRKVCSCLLP
jgi:5'-methylthioadenosine phosphorylase